LHFQILKPDLGNILERIIEKGGLIGTIAVYATDEQKVELFMTECFEQCQHIALQNFWGNELVKDVVHYRVKLLKFQYDQLKELCHLPSLKFIERLAVLKNVA
jgi:hypothetical protein